MKECVNCGKKSLMWQSDFDFEELGYEGEGIVSFYTCSNCGAEIECAVPINTTDKEAAE